MHSVADHELWHIPDANINFEYVDQWRLDEDTWVANEDWIVADNSRFEWQESFHNETIVSGTIDIRNNTPIDYIESTHFHSESWDTTLQVPEKLWMRNTPEKVQKTTWEKIRNIFNKSQGSGGWEIFECSAEWRTNSWEMCVSPEMEKRFKETWSLYE